MRRALLVTGLLLLLSVLLPVGCDSSSGSHGNSSTSKLTAPQTPHLVTRQVIEEITQGRSDDFAGMSKRLGDTYALFPKQEDLRVMKAFMDFFAYLRQTALNPVPTLGRARRIYTQLGYTNQNEVGGVANLFDISLQRKSTLGGSIPSTTLRSNEFLLNIHDAARNKELYAELAKLSNSLNQTPTNFSYLFSDLSVSGHSFSRFLNRDYAGSFVLDYGDLMMIRAWIELGLAFADYALAHDLSVLLDDLDDQDVPPKDALQALAFKYLAFADQAATAATRFANSKAHVNTSFAAYQAAATHILGENPPEPNGLFTVHASKFRSSLHRSQVLSQEQYFRTTWMPALTSAFTSTAFVLTTAPKGSTLQRSATLNLARFWHTGTTNAVNWGDLFLQGKAVVDPFSGGYESGVTSLSQLTQSMATFGGVLTKVGTQTPSVGDLQDMAGGFMNYMLRINQPGIVTSLAPIKIDSDISDWKRGINCTVAATTPFVATRGVKLGDILIGRDATDLYVAITEDNLALLSSFWDRFTMDIEDPALFLRIQARGQSPSRPSLWHFFWPTSGSKAPTYLKSPTRIEVKIPIQNFAGNWVKIAVALEGVGSKGKIDVERGPIYVRIR